MSQISVDRLLTSAKKLAQNGDINAARVLYTQIIESYPQNLRARKALEALNGAPSLSPSKAPTKTPSNTAPSGAAISDDERQKLTGMLQNGQIAEAIAYAENLLKIYPDHPMLVEMIARTCLMQNAHQKGKPYLEKLVKMNPGDETHVTNLLGCLSQLNDFLGMINTGKAHLAHNPKHMPSLYALVNGYTGVELYHLAADALEQAYALEPDNPEIHAALGTTFLEAKKYNKAATFFKQRLKQLPKDSHQEAREIKLSLIDALHGADKNDEALKLCDTLIEDKQAEIDAYVKQGHIHMVAGMKQEAAKSFRKALSKDKNSSGALTAMIKLQKVTDPDKVNLEWLEKSFNKAFKENADKPDIRDVNIGFAVGKAYDDLGRTTKAFNILSKANQLHETLHPYDTAYVDKLCFTLKHIFSPIDFKQLDPSLARPKAKRSNKKMIFIIGMPRSGTSLVEQILASHSKIFGGGELDAMGEATGELLYHFSRQPHVKLIDRAFGSIGQTYLDNISEIKCAERILTDKMPHNFLRLGFIHAAFPDAKIINISRDSMAVCWSSFKHQFKSRGMDYSYSLENLAHHYKAYLDLMEFWRGKFGDAIYELDYEKLTTNQKPQTQALLDFCQVDFEPACIDFHKTERNVKTASQVQVRQKMYKNSSKEWEAYASRLKPLRDGLGIEAS